MGVIGIFKERLRDGAFHRWLQWRRDQKVLKAWKKASRPPPPPQSFKKNLIRTVARQYGTRVLVETGTNWGHTVASSLGSFDVIYSIELFDELYEKAVRRFARHSKVKLRHGDSARELPRILEELGQPALFWLDAHYSGDGTARADLDTPIIQELQTISRHRVSNHVILIDDARCFDGTNDYPTLGTCRELASEFWPCHEFAVVDDIIRITPR